MKGREPRFQYLYNTQRWKRLRAWAADRRAFVLGQRRAPAA